MLKREAQNSKVENGHDEETTMGRKRPQERRPSQELWQ